MTEAASPDRRLVLRTLAMPADLNAGGTIFGGWLLGQMDMAAGMAASAYCRRQALTVAMNEVGFARPLLAGEIVEAYATLQRVGRTSMTFRIEVEAGPPTEASTLPVCAAIFIMVCVDDNGRPVAIN